MKFETRNTVCSEIGRAMKYLVLLLNRDRWADLDYCPSVPAVNASLVVRDEATSITVSVVPVRTAHS